jgi:ComF family protein
MLVCQHHFMKWVDAVRTSFARARWQRCALCAAPLPSFDALCPPCLDALPSLTHTCPICANPLEVAAAACGACLQHPPAFDRAFAAFAYRAPVVHLIHGLKYAGKLSNASLLGRLFAIRLQQAGAEPPDVLLPVPLHVNRLRERGFNQSLELARPLARAFGVPLDKTGVARVRETVAQAGLDLPERKKNLRGAFEARKSYEGLKVAIVDDVMTTGATVQTLSQALRKAGAKSVHVWVLARA